MKYTKIEEANKKIEKDMRVIVSELRERIPKVISIFLTGGFARGEGPVKKEGGKYYPYNDYDIQVVSEVGLSKEKIDKISIEISEKLGYAGIGYFYDFKKQEQKFKENFYIDLKVDTFDGLRKFLPRIRTVELKENSRLMWGKEIRGLIPEYKLNEMPLGEGAKLLLDRMSQMIQYYSTKRRYEKEALSYYIQQAYAACCTALLQLSGKYQIGYEKAMNIFKKNYKKDFPELAKKLPDLHKKIEQFIKWKRNPQKLPNENVEEEWFIARKNILEVSFYFFGKFLEKKIESVEELSNAILNMRRKFYLPYLNAMIRNKIKINPGKLGVLLLPFVSLLFKYKYYFRLKKKERKFSIFFTKSPDLIIFGSLPYLIGSISQRGIDDKILKKGRRILQGVYDCRGQNWENVSLEYGNAYIAFFLQKI